MKNILSKFKKWKAKKAAADLVSIIVSVVIVSALVLGILLFLSNKVRNTAMDEINNTMNTITGIAEANRNNADIVIPGGPGGAPSEPEINIPITHEGVIPEGGTYYVGVTATSLRDYSGATETYSAGQEFPATVNDGDVYVYGDYEYRYNRSTNGYGSWNTYTSQNGWGVNVLDKTKTTCGEILTSINNANVVSLENTFYNFTNLTVAPAIPNNVTNMSYTFRGCTGLTDVSDLIIPNSVTVMSYTFADCTGLTDISDLIIPSSLTKMWYTFKGCTGLTEAPVIPNSVTNMNGTFNCCTSLTKAPVIPSSVTEMSYTFYGCTGLTDVSNLVIPSGVTNMMHTFEDCTNLTGEIEINVSILWADSNCFYGTKKPIKIIGSTTLKAGLAATANNGNVTY